MLLGTIEQPVLPAPSCSPMAVETGDIQACICTTDLCSGLAGQEDTAALATELEGVTADRPGQEVELAREVEAVFGGPQMAGGRGQVSPVWQPLLQPGEDWTDLG